VSGGKHEQDYWISYSDLATGLMIVFMLVMLLQLLQIQQAQQDNTASLRKIVSEISATATARREIAVELKKRLDPLNIWVDPVTAQIDIPDGFVSFGERNWRIPLDDRGRLARLMVAYVDAVYSADCADATTGCGPTEEADLGSIRRILVTGHADLMGNAAENHWLSAMRAEVVVQFTADLLRCAAGLGPRELPRGPIAGAVNTWAEPFSCPQTSSRCGSPELAPICESGHDPAKWRDVWRWVEPRLQAAGAGDLEHCQAISGELAGTSCDAAPSATRREDTVRRKISLELDVVGSDFTGLVHHTVQLCRQGLAEEETCDKAARLHGHIVTRCQEDRKRTDRPDPYAACDDAITACNEGNFEMYACGSSGPGRGIRP
jgi:hypothetical protein